MAYNFSLLKKFFFFIKYIVLENILTVLAGEAHHADKLKVLLDPLLSAMSLLCVHTHTHTHIPSPLPFPKVTTATGLLPDLHLMNLF